MLKNGKIVLILIKIVKQGNKKQGGVFTPRPALLCYLVLIWVVILCMSFAAGCASNFNSVIAENIDKTCFFKT